MTILKTLVISMGFLLLGGVALLGGLAWQKASSGAGASVCAGGHASLKGRGVIVDSVIQGHSVIVTMERDDGSDDVATIDICTGKITGDLSIEGDVVSESNRI